MNRTDPDLRSLLHFGLLNRGLFLSARGSACLSTPMTHAEVDNLITAIAEVIDPLAR